MSTAATRALREGVDSPSVRMLAGMQGHECRTGTQNMTAITASAGTCAFRHGLAGREGLEPAH